MPNYERIAWMPDSSGFVGVGVAGDGQTTIILEGRAGGFETIARYPTGMLGDVRTGAAAISADGERILLTIPDRGYVVLNRQGQEMLTLPRNEDAYANGWKPMQ